MSIDFQDIFVCVPSHPHPPTRIPELYISANELGTSDMIELEGLKGSPPPGRVSYLLCSLIKEEDPPRRTWYKFFERVLFLTPYSVV